MKNARKYAFGRNTHGRGRPANARFRRAHGGGDGVVLYGWHTVTAALANPARHIRKILATENAVRRLADDGIALPIEPELVRPDAIAARLSPDAVHQGLLAEADPLPSPPLADLAAAGVVLVLDQITDPHNVGAILRTAAALPSPPSSPLRDTARTRPACWPNPRRARSNGCRSLPCKISRAPLPK